MLEKVGNASWRKVIRIDETCSRNAIAKMFEEATAAQPSLVVIDDLERLAGSKSEFLLSAGALSREIERIGDAQIQVIATASRQGNIDEKILKRFRERIELSIPTSKSRLEILRDLVEEDTLPDVLEYVAERTHAFTVDDLMKLCDKADDAAEIRGDDVGSVWALSQVRRFTDVWMFGIRLLIPLRLLLQVMGTLQSSHRV